LGRLRRRRVSSSFLTSVKESTSGEKERGVFPFVYQVAETSPCIRPSVYQRLPNTKFLADIVSHVILGWC
jgi:hypothetical protein